MAENTDWALPVLAACAFASAFCLFASRAQEERLVKDQGGAGRTPGTVVGENFSAIQDARVGGNAVAAALSLVGFGISVMRATHVTVLR